MAKAWKSKQGANTKLSGSDTNRCNNMDCRHWEMYLGCSIKRNFKQCDLYHVRPKFDKR